MIYIPDKVRGLLGKDVRITCKANGYPRAKITWFNQYRYQAPYGYRQEVDNEIDGESSLIIKKLVTSDSGRYTCEASGDLGPSDVASVELSVYGTFD